MGNNQSHSRINEKLLEIVPFEFSNDEERIIDRLNENNRTPTDHLEQPVDF